MTDTVEKNDAPPAEQLALPAVPAKATRPFHGVKDVEGTVGWVQPDEIIDVTPARRAELVAAGMIEREDGDAPEVETSQAAEPLGGTGQKNRKLKVSGGPAAAE
ncbi:hypothetical protein D3C72_288140 [compost metagenome]